MKKKILALILIIVIMVLQCACKTNRVIKPDENTVVIEVSSEGFDINNKTLLDYMNYLQGQGELSFEISDGMITKLNGKSNNTTSYWMLYTSDSEKSNTAWGTIEYNNNTYGSATYGANQIKIKEGCLYIWAYQTF